MDFFKNKKILVTGGTGMIGRSLVTLLTQKEAQVRVVSLDDPSVAPKNVEFVQADLRFLEDCLRVCEDREIVFHLAGVKGSPAMTAERPASFFVPTLMFSLNMMEAARRCGVEDYLFTSSIGVYAPANVFVEDDVWKTFPSPNDRFAGWAKRMGELQAESYKIEYNWDKISIVRPANVYGPFDNFDPNNAMVIPSLIHRAIQSKGFLTVWGDGSPIRDFIYTDDVAEGMLLALKQGVHEPLNLGSGVGHSIREVVETITSHLDFPVQVTWDTSKPSGDRQRLMDMTRSASYGFKVKTNLSEGIRKTIDWYKKNQDVLTKRYNPFTEKTLLPHAEK